MTTDDVKQPIGRYWGARAAGFDEQFLHSVATDAERQAWNRILDRLADSGRGLDVLDLGCGTGFLALLCAERGHRVTGSDLAPEMIERAQVKAREQHLAVHFVVDDAEALQLSDASFDLVVCRHLFWTLPHPDKALAEWIRVTRPGGRMAIIDGQWGERPTTVGAGPSTGDAATEIRPMQEAYGADVIASLPNFGGAPAEYVAQLLRRHDLQDVQIDSLDDLVAAQQRRMTEQERQTRSSVRYMVYGDRTSIEV